MVVESGDEILQLGQGGFVVAFPIERDDILQSRLAMIGNTFNCFLTYDNVWLNF